MSYYFIAGTGLIGFYGLYKMLTRKAPDIKTYEFVNIKRLNETWEKGFNEIDEEVTCSEYYPPENNNNIKEIINHLYYKFDTIKKEDKEDTETVFDKIEKFFNNISMSNISNLRIILHISSSGGIAYKFEKIHNNIIALRNMGHHITAFIDDMCASGGYMMASACDEIICTDTATIGSIGVYANTFNFHELAQKIGMKELVFKTSNHKGGIPEYSQYNEEEVISMKKSIDYTFNNFKRLIKMNRPNVDIDIISTAETWYGYDALEKGLVDRITTRYEYLNELNKSGDVYSVDVKANKKERGLLYSLFLKDVNYTINIINQTIERIINCKKIYT
jgi:signal peptide peptidase SppA